MKKKEQDKAWVKIIKNSLYGVIGNPENHKNHFIMYDKELADKITKQGKEIINKLKDGTDDKRT